MARKKEDGAKEVLVIAGAGLAVLLVLRLLLAADAPRPVQQ